MSRKRIKKGLAREATYEVDMERSATTLGSGTLEVLGTPALGIMAEQVCREMVDPLLEAGQTTVGSMLNIRHFAPTPIGDVVRLRAEVVFVEGNTIEFEVKIWDSAELVGEVDHRRVIIKVDRFMKVVRSKHPHSQ